MSVINILVYCNGIIWFHKSVDATGKSQDSTFLLKVAPKHVQLDVVYFCQSY
jgi:hypothetical protein